MLSLPSSGNMTPCCLVDSTSVPKESAALIFMVTSVIRNVAIRLNVVTSWKIVILNFTAKKTTNFVYATEILRIEQRRMIAITCKNEFNSVLRYYT